MKTVIKNKRELANVAREVLEMKPGIIALEGPLGAGKTTFTKILAKQLGIKENVTSPTFVINVQYSMPNVQYKLEHIDCWRMESGSELEQLGFEKMIDNRSLIVIEWADQVRDTILKYKDRAKVVWVKFEYGDKVNFRIVAVSKK